MKSKNQRRREARQRGELMRLESIAKLRAQEEDRIPPFFPFAEEEPMPPHFPFALEINPDGEFVAVAARRFEEDLFWEDYWDRNGEASPKKKDTGQRDTSRRQNSGAGAIHQVARAAGAFARFGVNYNSLMGTAALVSVEEYLSTSYEDGDREYVDGEVLERNLGEIEHSDIQGSVISHLRRHYRSLAWCGPECRVQVKARRFRVPDVSVVLGQKPAGRIIKNPPFLVIEVLSPEDRADRMQTKITDYLEFGVQNIWVIDPVTRSATAYTPNGVIAVREGSLRTADPLIELPLAELF